MLHRFALKIGGASGTGINTVGLVLARALKRAKYYNFANREYPSLIKGGFASYQLDASDAPINSPSSKPNVLVAIDKASFEFLSKQAGENQHFIYDKSSIRATEEDLNSIRERGGKIYELTLAKIAKEIGGNAIMKNTVLVGAIWKLLGFDQEILVSTILDIFNKTPEIEEANKKCALAGFELVETDRTIVLDRFNPTNDIQNDLSITGNEAIALGGIAAGVRAYFAYPMTPSSTVLNTMAKFAKNTGMIVKQAEDEITAASLTIGASFAGTRAMTGTSGGGFDLMSETVSLAGITELPFVVVLAQRPGPATGLPTWTSQGDLNLAIYAGHGEYPKVVLAPGDPTECFDLTVQAHNIADIFQIPVIILTDKFLAESQYTVTPFDQSKVTVDRGELYYEMEDKLKNRYELTESGISPRWVPGIDANTYLINSDEHDEYGHSTEDLELAQKMLDKRMRKESKILEYIPEPVQYGPDDSEVSIVCWGSVKHIVVDAIEELRKEGINVNLLHYSYVFPLKTQRLYEFRDRAKKLLLVENNQTAQFGSLIKSKTDVNFTDTLVKYNGTQFNVEEVIEKVKSLISQNG